MKMNSFASHLALSSLALSLSLYLLPEHAVSQSSNDAASLYHDYCSVCHGDQGDGQSRARQGLIPPPANFTAAGLAERLSRETMIEVVKNGRTGTAMSGWKTRLNDQQVASIVDYIRSEFMQQDAPVSAHTNTVSRGAQIYTYACSVCHGDKGNGAVWASRTLNPPPRDFTAAAISRERIISTITHGSSGTAMPSFKSQYSDDEIADVADYIIKNFIPADKNQQTSQQAVKTDRKSFFNQPYPNNLSADLASGEAIYRFNCATCHGNSGAGNGPRAYFIFPKPRNFLTITSRESFNRPALYKAVRDGVPRKEMPAWRYVLNEQDIANVSEYVLQNFILADQQKN